MTFESIQTTAYTTSGTLTITKPASLALNELLVAFIHGQQANITPPSGWTLIKRLIAGGGGSDLRIYSVVATSTQVSASNFAWTNGGEPIGGSICRITGENIALPTVQFGFDDATATATPTFTSTVTPDTANSLLLYCLGTYTNSSATRTASGYAIATSNPSWTERADQTIDGGGSNYCFQMSLATASRPETSATGDASVTLSGLCTDLGVVMLVVRPQITATITETISLVESLKKTLSKIFTETISLSEVLSILKSRLWTKISKPSTTWTKRQK